MRVNYKNLQVACGDHSQDTVENDNYLPLVAKYGPITSGSSAALFPTACERQA